MGLSRFMEQSPRYDSVFLLIRHYDQNIVSLSLVTVFPDCLRYGEHNAYGGSRYKPKKLGRILVEHSTVKDVRELTDEDARNDGFALRDYLLLELGRLNRLLDARDSIVIHQVKVLEDLLPRLFL